MGRSNNPEGTARVSDGDIVAELRSQLKNSDKLAVPARDVAAGLPIKKQAVGKRLNKLVQSGDRVRRFKGSQAWLYHLQEAEQSTTVNGGGHRGADRDSSDPDQDEKYGAFTRAAVDTLTGACLLYGFALLWPILASFNAMHPVAARVSFSLFVLFAAVSLAASLLFSVLALGAWLLVGVHPGRPARRQVSARLGNVAGVATRIADRGVS